MVKQGIAGDSPNTNAAAKNPGPLSSATSTTIAVDAQPHIAPGSYAADVTAWATVVLTAATIALAYLTWVLGRATNRAAVILTIEPNAAALFWLDLHIVNEGNATAHDVQITFDPPLPSSGGQMDRITMPSGVSVLRAGQHIVTSLCEAKVIIDMMFEVTISWKASPKSRRRQSVVYPLTLAHLHNISRLGNDPQIASAQELKKIRESIERVASGRGRVKVDGYTQQDRDAAQRDAHERHHASQEELVVAQPHAMRRALANVMRIFAREK